MAYIIKFISWVLIIATLIVIVGIIAAIAIFLLPFALVALILYIIFSKD